MRKLIATALIGCLSASVLFASGTLHAEMDEYCNTLKKDPYAYKALEWAASVEMKKNTKCVDIASVELAEKLTTEKHYGFFLGVQSGGISDAEIDVIAKQIMDGTFGK
ncbi:MAG: hypothetical protein PHE67_10420 [Campylobacterales bacterium]|nr:hypothetical protein [Campylobacterales bacterium]